MTEVAIRTGVARTERTGSRVVRLCHASGYTRVRPTVTRARRAHVGAPAHARSHVRRRDLRAQVWSQVDPKAEWQYGMSPYTVNNANPISYADPHGDIAPLVVLGAMAVGGGLNVWRQWDQIQSGGTPWRDGLVAFGIGAGATGVGIGTGGAAAGLMAGGTGLGAAIGVGAAAGAVGGGTAGFIQGAGNGVYFGRGDLGDRLNQGLHQGLYEGAIGFGTGFVLGGATGAAGYWISQMRGGVPAGNVGAPKYGDPGFKPGPNAGGSPSITAGQASLEASQAGIDVAASSAQWGYGVSSVASSGGQAAAQAASRPVVGNIINTFGRNAHGLHQAINRGVKPGDILNTVRNGQMQPVQGARSIVPQHHYIHEGQHIVVDPLTGKVITVFAPK